MSDDHTIAEAAAEVSDSELRAIERMAVELANLAGAEIVTALGSEFAVQYKTPSADEISGETRFRRWITGSRR